MTIDQLKDEFKKLFFIKDDFVIDLLIATVISTHYIHHDPIWLMIVGAPSSGKTELINSLLKIKFVHPISDMTENTLLSGMNNTVNEPSFLLQMGSFGCIVMKDFTSILSMREEKRKTIIAQFRDVHDGQFDKKTGNGKNPKWKGKANFIGGVTEAIYLYSDEIASMGQRNIYYVLPEMTDAERIETSRVARANRSKEGIRLKRIHLQDMVLEYVEEILGKLPDILPEVPKDISENIFELANFVSKASSGTQRDYQGVVEFATSITLPMRISEEIHMVAEMFLIMYGGKIPKEQEEGLYKVALDIIPKQKRMALNILSSYTAASTKGIAMHIKYPTIPVLKWLEDLNMLGIVERKHLLKSEGGDGRVDSWFLLPEYKTLMLKYDKSIKQENKELVAKDGDEESDAGFVLEEQAQADDAFQRAKEEFGIGI